MGIYRGRLSETHCSGYYCIVLADTLYFEFNSNLDRFDTLAASVFLCILSDGVHI